MKNNIEIKTLDRKDVERLSALNKNRYWAASFYLGVRGDRDFLVSANSFLSEKAKELEKKNFSRDEKRQIREIFKSIEDKLRVIKLPDRTRTFIIFCNAHRMMKIYKLPMYIPSRLVVERDIYVHPYIKNLRRYPRYAVVFLERDRAKIFEYFWGEVENETAEIRTQVPQRMNAARVDWKGLSEKRIQGHIEVHIDRHLKKVAGAVERYMHKNEISHLIIGSRRELIERFKEHLPTAVRKKVAGSYLVRADQSLDRIKTKSLEVIDRFEMEREEEMIEKLMEGNSKKLKEAVLGAGQVMERLEKYNIHMLVVGKDYRQPGYFDTEKRKIYLSKKEASVSGGGAFKVGDVADELLEIAIERKLRVMHFIHNHEKFDKFGIGAILK